MTFILTFALSLYPVSTQSMVFEETSAEGSGGSENGGQFFRSHRRHQRGGDIFIGSEN